MVHYLAEVMARAQAAEGAEKATAERECFEVILQFWKHRASLPGSRRPMDSFEPVFHTLGRILDHKHLVYFERTEQHLDPDSENWLDLAAGIDHAARELIRWCIVMASSEAVKKDGVWLENETARALDDGPDLKAARLLVENMKIFVGTEEQLAESQAKELTEMRNRLDRLVSMGEIVRDQIDAALSDTPRKD